jgi:hypothetical protein
VYSNTPSDSQMYTADKGITIQRQQRAASIKLIKYIGKDTPRNINFTHKDKFIKHKSKGNLLNLLFYFITVTVSCKLESIL